MIFDIFVAFVIVVISMSYPSGLFSSELIPESRHHVINVSSLSRSSETFVDQVRLTDPTAVYLDFSAVVVYLKRV